jgi:FAD/FMN-containing dehydrogenase
VRALDVAVTGDVVDRLVSMLGQGNVLVGNDVSARFDGWPPVSPVSALCIARPNTTAEVSAVLQYCDRARIAVVPQGGRTGLAKGARANPCDVVLSLERLNRIEAIDVAGNTMTVEAGVPLQRVQEAAAEQGLFYPVDLGARGSATIGGTIATNAGGNRVLRFGMTREQVLGVEAVLPDGTVVSSLNRLLKNNAGYDLKQLFIGSEGTLGVVTRAVLRLRPGLGRTATALVAASRLEALLELLRRLSALARDSLTGFEVMWPEFVDTVLTSGRHKDPFDTRHGFWALIEVANSDAGSVLESVIGAALEDRLVSDAVVATSEAQAAALWAIREDSEARAAALKPAIHFDIGLPQSTMSAYVDSVYERLRTRWPAAKLLVFGHVGDCNIHLTVGVGATDPESRHAVEEIVYEPLRALGGTVSAEHGIGLEKRDFLSVTRNPAEIALMRRLKSALDPNQTLNPGKILG